MATVVRAYMPLPTPPAAVASSSATPSTDAPRRSSSSTRVLVLGGTGRVGGSTATALSKLRPGLNILIAGRNRNFVRRSLVTEERKEKDEAVQWPDKFEARRGAVEEEEETTEQDQGGRLDFKIKGGLVPNAAQEPNVLPGPRTRRPNSHYTGEQWVQ